MGRPAKATIDESKETSVVKKPVEKPVTSIKDEEIKNIETVKAGKVETVKVEKTEVKTSESSFTKTYKVVSNSNKKIYGTTGKLIEFNDKGIAYVDFDDAAHLRKIPGYTVEE